MSDEQFSKPIRAYAGGASPKINISSVSEAASHIATLHPTVRQRLHWQLAEKAVESAQAGKTGKDIAELAVRNALASDGNVLS